MYDIWCHRVHRQKKVLMGQQHLERSWVLGLGSRCGLDLGDNALHVMRNVGMVRAGMPTMGGVVK